MCSLPPIGSRSIATQPCLGSVWQQWDLWWYWMSLSWADVRRIISNALWNKNNCDERFSRWWGWGQKRLWAASTTAWAARPSCLRCGTILWLLHSSRVRSWNCTTGQSDVRFSATAIRPWAKFLRRWSVLCLEQTDQESIFFRTNTRSN